MGESPHLKSFLYVISPLQVYTSTDGFTFSSPVGKTFTFSFFLTTSRSGNDVRISREPEMSNPNHQAPIQRGWDGVMAGTAKNRKYANICNREQPGTLNAITSTLNIGYQCKTGIPNFFHHIILIWVESDFPHYFGSPCNQVYVYIKVRNTTVMH